MDKDNNQMDVDVDTGGIFFADTTFADLPSATPSTPNSSASSPPIANDDFTTLAPQGFLQNILSQFNQGISDTTSSFSTSNTTTALTAEQSKQQALARRGPGRPRKENPLLFIRSLSGGKAQQTKRKLNKEQSSSSLPSPNEAASTANAAARSLSMIASSSENSNAGYPEEKLLLTPAAHAVIIDEPPYFAEKYAGKVCCLCNLSERSALGQGDLLRYEVTEGSSENITTTTTTPTAILLDENNEQQQQNVVNNDMEFKNLKDVDDNKCSQLQPNTASENNSNQFNKNTPPGNNCRRIKNANKCKIVSNSEDLNELDRVGHGEGITMKSLYDGRFLYVHVNCALWSLGLNGNGVESITAQQVEAMVDRSLKQKCFFCGMFGATVNCRMSCPKVYHMPCSAAANCFQIIENYTAFCCDHTSQVPMLCVSDINLDCRQCSTLGDISKLIMCSLCGDHYHTTCIGLADLPDTRAGWNCSQCCKCQICRQTDANEGRAVKCEQCQKIYHAACLRPVLSSVPKYGWKCRRCRICTDCGSRTPGAGTSSRWHCHYTICDSCYQQRNKGLSCPMCHRAYRAAANKEMVKCSSCSRFVHSTCDSEADLVAHQKRKELNHDYEYTCPMCKAGYTSVAGVNVSFGGMTPGRDTSFGGDITGGDFCDGVVDKLNGSGAGAIILGHSADGSPNTGTSNTGSYGKPFDAFRISKKRIGRGGNGGAGGGGKMMLQKHNMLTQIGRKRSVRGKNRNMLLLGNASGASGSSGANLERSNSRNNAEDAGNEKKLLLCSIKDKFVLSQDICVMCGAVGMDQEAALISCAQCGQCYHPFCANIKLSKVMLQKGWRCLDCTVCEGCGQKNDEARLILCDDCDISYHIYCMSPPLDTVPNGNWKCKWCAICQKCGRTSPGKNCKWRNGFLECGPCASHSTCCICYQGYKDNELIIQCGNCERWLHCQCDAISNEEEAKLCDKADYHCLLCRPKDLVYPPPLIAVKNTAKLAPPHKLNHQQQHHHHQLHSASLNGASKSGGKQHHHILDHDGTVNMSGSGGSSSNNCANDDNGAHWVDGVCVNERGLNMIKALTTEMKKKRRLRPGNDAAQIKDSGILAAIESVVAGQTGGSNNNNKDTANNDNGDDESQKKKLLEISNYKDGMVWQGAQDCPPEGFFITTNEEGIKILRKKRQRNLQKLGIGGFNVRNRAIKKDTITSGGSVCSNNNNAEENGIVAADNLNQLNSQGQQQAIISEKKKKLARKKMKSKLCDTYPAYLQEAFFGKSLLDATPTNAVAAEMLHGDSEHSNDLLDSTSLMLAMHNDPDKPQHPQQQQPSQSQLYLQSQQQLPIKPDKLVIQQHQQQQQQQQPHLLQQQQQQQQQQALLLAQNTQPQMQIKVEITDINEQSIDTNSNLTGPMSENSTSATIMPDSNYSTPQQHQQQQPKYATFDANLTPKFEQQEFKEELLSTTTIENLSVEQQQKQQQLSMSTGCNIKEPQQQQITESGCLIAKVEHDEPDKSSIPSSSVLTVARLQQQYGTNSSTPTVAPTIVRTLQQQQQHNLDTDTSNFNTQQNNMQNAFLNNPPNMMTKSKSIPQNQYQYFANNSAEFSTSPVAQIRRTSYVTNNNINNNNNNNNSNINNNSLNILQQSNMTSNQQPVNSHIVQHPQQMMDATSPISSSVAATKTQMTQNLQLNVLQSSKPVATPSAMSNVTIDIKPQIQQLTQQQQITSTLPQQSLDIKPTFNHININKQHQQHQSSFVESVSKPVEQLSQQQQLLQVQTIINSTQSNYQQQQQPQQQQQVVRESTLKTFLLPAKTTVIAASASIASPLVEENFEPNIAGTQKTAEKMRRDEALGEMATISAVLYANTQHPELKQQFPNWSDRCKQILKRWRSLSTEKKAPFLQHAKDNRSALRMRRTQQDQEKICFQQKSLKEQEQERIWKQHQAKAKEAHASIYGSDGKLIGLPVDCGKPQQQQQQQQLPTQQTQQQRFGNITPTTPVQGGNQGFQPNFMTGISNGAEIDKNDVTPSTSMQLQHQSCNSNAANIVDNIVVDNKQLRTLLQRPEYTATWLDNDAKMSLQQQQQQPQQQQQQQSTISVGGGGLVATASNAPVALASTLFQQQQHDTTTNKMSMMLEVHKLPGRMQQQQQQQQQQQLQLLQPGGNNNTITVKSISLTQAQQQQQPASHNVISENVPVVSTVELERLDQYENTGLGDILGGLGEGDDDELFQSLTSEIGEDFNILEYADPELDALASSQNLLNKLDFDDNDKNA